MSRPPHTPISPSNAQTHGFLPTLAGAGGPPSAAAAAATRGTRAPPEILSEGPWRVVTPTDAPPDPSLFPVGQAVVVYMQLGCVTMARALGYLRALRDLEVDASIVLLLVPPLGTPRAVGRELVLDAVEAFHEEGFDDCVALGEDAAEAHLAIEVCLRRMMYTEAHFEAFERAVVERCDNRVRQKTKELVAAHAEELWRWVPKLWPRLPKSGAEVPSKVSVGTSVGPCVAERFLGKGSFGAVFSATNLETREVEAVKMLSKQGYNSLEKIQALVQEIDSLRRLSHRNIVGFRGVVHGTHSIFIRTELAGTQNLLQMQRAAGGRVEPGQAASFFAQLAVALAHCHGNDIAHRDLKPENLVVSSDCKELKVVDFGTSVYAKGLCRDVAGTMPFVAPEVLMCQGDVRGKDGYAPRAADIWSSGVVLLEMLSGFGKLCEMMGWPARLTPLAEHAEQLKEHFRRCPRSVTETLLAEGLEVSPDLAELFEGLLALDPSRRPPAPEIRRNRWCSSPLDDSAEAEEAAVAAVAAEAAGLRRGSGGGAGEGSEEEPLTWTGGPSLPQGLRPLQRGRASRAARLYDSTNTQRSAVSDMSTES